MSLVHDSILQFFLFSIFGVLLVNFDPICVDPCCTQPHFWTLCGCFGISIFRWSTWVFRLCGVFFWQPYNPVAVGTAFLALWFSSSRLWLFGSRIFFSRHPLWFATHSFIFLGLYLYIALGLIFCWQVRFCL